MDATVTLGRQGRLVIPADVRQALGLAPGDRLHLSVRGNAVVLSRPEDAIAGLRALGHGRGGSRSLVDELIEDRRSEALAE